MNIASFALRTFSNASKLQLSYRKLCESKGTESKNLESEKSVRKFSPKKSRIPSDYTYRIRVNYT